MSNHTISSPAGIKGFCSLITFYVIGIIISFFLISGYGTNGLCIAADRPSKSAAVNKKSRKNVHHPRTLKKSSLKPSKTRNVKPVSTGVQAKAVYCINLANNQTLITKNADEKLPIASLTKLVTALLTLDHMPLDKPITIPEHIKKVPKSVVGLKPGDTLSVEDLLRGMLISSGNDCAEALACAFPGGKPGFIAALNKKARSLGATNTKFFTPSGLDKKIPNSSNDDKDPEVDANVSTAREMANITRIAFANNTIRSISKTTSCVLASKLNPQGYHIRNTNRLLRDNLPVVGGKTGFTVRAGHCLTSEFSPGKERLVIVVLGSPDHFRDTRLLYAKALKQSQNQSNPALPARSAQATTN